VALTLPQGADVLQGVDTPQCAVAPHPWRGYSSHRQVSLNPLVISKGSRSYEQYDPTKKISKKNLICILYKTTAWQSFLKFAQCHM
jgi:hypothetical protein